MTLSLGRVRLRHVWSIIPAAFAFCYAASVPITHSDLFYMMLNGQLMGQQHLFPLTIDPFTYAPADPMFFNQPWIAQLLLWGADQLGDFPLIILLHALAMSSAFVALTWLVRRDEKRPAAAALLVLLGLALTATNFSIRPQSFALLPFVACLALLRKGRIGDRRTYVGMWLLTLVWANLHGSFFLALMLCGAHLAGALYEHRGLGGRSVRHYATLLASALVGTLINPVGPLVWLYVLRAGMDPTNRGNIAEWQPLSVTSLTGQIVLATLPIIALIFFFTRRRLRAKDVILVVSFGALAVMSQRAVIWWGLLIPVVLSSQLGAPDLRGEPDRKQDKGFLNAAILLCVLGLMALSIPWFRGWDPLLDPGLRGYLSSDHPTGAAAFLQETGAEGRLFARMEWGGYLSWRLWPRMHVFLDARIEQHPPAVWRDYFAILSASPGWENELESYGADYVLLERAPYATLVSALDANPSWHELYSDDLSVLYKHTAA